MRRERWRLENGKEKRREEGRGMGEVENWKREKRGECRHEEGGEIDEEGRRKGGREGKVQEDRQRHVVRNDTMWRDAGRKDLLNIHM